MKIILTHQEALDLIWKNPSVLKGFFPPNSEIILHRDEDCDDEGDENEIDDDLQELLKTDIADSNGRKLSDEELVEMVLKIPYNDLVKEFQASFSLSREDARTVIRELKNNNPDIQFACKSLHIKWIEDEFIHNDVDFRKELIDILDRNPVYIKSEKKKFLPDDELIKQILEIPDKHLVTEFHTRFSLNRDDARRMIEEMKDKFTDAEKIIDYISTDYISEVMDLRQELNDIIYNWNPVKTEKKSKKVNMKFGKILAEVFGYYSYGAIEEEFRKGLNINRDKARALISDLKYKCLDDNQPYLYISYVEKYTKDVVQFCDLINDMYRRSKR